MEVYEGASQVWPYQPAQALSKAFRPEDHRSDATGQDKHCFCIGYGCGEFNLY